MRSLFARLLYAMCGVATAALGLALFLQGRSLSEDLRTAAERRLDTAATAAQRLLDGHLVSLSERYRAISGTPQFRATLEIDDGPTLSHYAGTLLEQSGALRVAFLGADDAVVAGAGDASLDAQAFGVKERGLIAHEGKPFAVASTPIADAGRLVAIEPIQAGVIAGWAELCGAEVGFAPRGVARAGDVRGDRLDPVGRRRHLPDGAAEVAGHAAEGARHLADLVRARAAERGGEIAGADPAGGGLQLLDRLHEPLRDDQAGRARTRSARWRAPSAA